LGFQRTGSIISQFVPINLTGTNFFRRHDSRSYLCPCDLQGLYPKTIKSTASYAKKDLSGINFNANNFTGWDFSEQDLSGANFRGATLSGANFTSASLANANLYSITNYTTHLTATDFTGADMRGVTGDYDITGATATKANTWIQKNTIWIDGTIGNVASNPGLDLSGGSTLIVRNYTVNSSGASASLPIKVYNKMNMGTDGILQIVVDDKTWQSTISFDSGISSVSLGAH